MQISDKILKDYLLGKCNAAQIETVLKWINESEDNAKRLFLLEDIYLAGRMQVNDKRLDASFKKLKQRISFAESRTKTRNRLLQIIGYAASVLLVAGLTFLTLQLINNTEDMRLAMATDKVETIVLPDGTKVWLNTDSSLEYPAEFQEKSRSVKLKGEAYFEVVKNPDCPFIVASDGMKVKVLGTSFNFNAKKGPSLEEVSLIEGKIQAIGNADEGKVTLRPGQKVLLDTKKGDMTVENSDLMLEAVWHDNLIPFKNANIRGIGDVLERFYPVSIHIDSGINMEATYSGIVSRHDSIDSVLAAIAYTLPINYRVSGNQVYLFAK